MSSAYHSIVKVLTAAALLMPSVISAQTTILIDFGSSASPGGASVASPDINGNYWNEFTPGAGTTDLVDIADSATLIDLNFVSPVMADGTSGPGGVFDDLSLGLLGITNAVNDYVYSPDSGTVRFELKDLDPFLLYDLTFYAGRQNPSGEAADDDATRTTVFTVTDSNLSELASATLMVGSGSVHNADTTAQLTGLMADDAGQIYVSISGLSATNAGYLNALQISAGKALPPEDGDEVLLIDFGSSSSYNGVDADSPDTQGLAWNSVWSGVYNGSLVNIEGDTTAIGLGFDSTVGTDNYNGPDGVIVEDDLAVLGGTTNAVNDYYISSTFQIQGLDTNRVYSLTFYGSHKYSDDPLTKYTLYTDGDYTQAVTSASLYVQHPTRPWEHNSNTVVTIRKAGPQPNGVIYVGFESRTGTNGYLNAMRIDSFDATPAPPPPPLRGDETILVDFGNDSSFRGTNVVSPDAQGSYWNSVWSGAFYANMVDVSNNATTVDLGFDATIGTDSFNGPNDLFDIAALDLLAATNAVNDYYLSSSFQVQGLVTTRTYNLTFYGAHKYSPEDATVYEVYSDSAYTQLVASATLNVQAPGFPQFHNSNSVVTISNLVPQAGNILYVKFQGATGSNGYLNAMRIDAFDIDLPEPQVTGPELGEETILVDFGNSNSYNGVDVASPDSFSNYWNSIWSGSFAANMVDISNNMTAVDIGFDAVVGTDNFNGPNGAVDPYVLGYLGVDEAVNDYYVNARFQVQGLVTTRTYSLTFFGSHKYSPEDATTYSIYSDSSYTQVVASGTLNVQVPGSPNLHNSNEVVTVSNLVPNSSGILYVGFEGATGSNGYLNAMRIDAFPRSFTPPPPPELGDETVLIDFGSDDSYNGTNASSPDAAGNYWNSVWSGVFNANLVTISNTATTIDLGFDATKGTDSFNGPDGVFDPAGLALLGDTNAVNDYYLSSSFQLQDLATGAVYSLTFYGSHKFSAEDATVYSVYADTNYSVLVAQASLDVQMPGNDAQHNTDYVVTITNLAPQADNALYIRFEGPTGSNGYLNAMRVDAFHIDAQPLNVPQGDQTVLIDFGSADSFNGADAVNPDSFNSYWNSVWSGAYYTNLVDISNRMTSINFGFDSAQGTDSFNGPGGDVDMMLLGLLGGTANAVNDYYISASFQIQNLTPGRYYNLTFYGSHKFSADDATVYSVYTDTNYNTLVDSVSLNVQNPSDPSEHNRGGIVMLTNLVPQANNTLYVKFEGSTGTNGYLNALRIDSFPMDLAMWQSANGVGGPYVDDDFDGLVNLGEFAFGGDPNNGSDTGLDGEMVLGLNPGGNNLYFTYPRRMGSDDELDYEVLICGSFPCTNDNWIAAGYPEIPPAGMVNDLYESVTNQVTGIDAGLDHIFIRVNVKQK